MHPRRQSARQHEARSKSAAIAVLECAAAEARINVNPNTLFPGGIVYEDKKNEERVVISEP